MKSQYQTLIADHKELPTVAGGVSCTQREGQSSREGKLEAGQRVSQELRDRRAEGRLGGSEARGGC